MKEKFLHAIDNKLKVSITFNAIEKGQIVRVCIPFDFGASQKDDAIDKSEKYHVWDLNSPDKPHNLALSPNDVVEIDILSEHFDPNDYVTWKPKWIYKRDWGNKS